MYKWKVLGLFFLMGIQTVLAQFTLKVSIATLDTSKGRVAIALYSDRDAFLNFENSHDSQIIEASNPLKEVVFTNLKEGTYAVAVYHDINNNGILDTNWIGIPKEPIGVSRNVKSRFGPPRFKECQFEVRKDEEIKVQLKKIG